MTVSPRRVPAPADRNRLVDVALGRTPADLVIRGTTIVDTATRELRPADIATVGPWIATVGDVGRLIGSDTTVIDADGLVAVPGLLDAHFHIEGSMVTVRELTRTLLPRGVTVLACDPHEIGNVLGASGMELLLDEGRGYPLKLFLRVPAELPGSPDLETSGGRLTDDDIDRLLERDDAISLAGDCSPTWLLDAAPSHLSRIDRALRRGLTINGQQPDLAPAELNAFAAAGPQDTHIASSAAALLDELRAGLKGVVNNMPFQFPDDELADLGARIRQGRLDPRHLLLCADDVHPNLLLRDGGVDAAVRRAIRCGVPPVAAVQLATINVASHYRLDQTFGSIAPGRVADLSLVESLERFEPIVVVADGTVVARDGQLVVDLERRPYPTWARQTVHVTPPITADDLRIDAPVGTADGAALEARAIYPGSAQDGRLLPGTAKQQRRINATVHAGAVVPDDGQDVAWAAVIDRHSGARRVGRCFVQGFGMIAGAVASTVNHDNHNLMVIGVDSDDMAMAANHVIGIGGGIAIARGGRILCDLALPVAGLISEDPIETVAAVLDQLETVLVDQIGVAAELTQPLMLLQMFALINVPALGLSDHGLIDVHAAAPVDTVIGDRL